MTTQRRKLKLRSLRDPAHPHLIQVIDVKTGKALSNVVGLDISFRAGQALAHGTMHYYKTGPDGQRVTYGHCGTFIEKETVDIVGLVSYMAIKPICDKCQKELDEPGAILLSPPNEKGQVQKFHLCLRCYGEVAEWLKAPAC